MILLAFIIPLAVYCLILAYLNRHPHPVMVPGPWDFAGVLLGSSGLLLMGGPAILTVIYEQWRLAWLLGRNRFFQNLGENWYFWVGVWVAYFIFIVAGAGLALWRQRGKTSIYNVHRDAFMEVFLQVCERLELEVVSSGRHFALRSHQVKAEGLISTAQQAAAGETPTPVHNESGSAWATELDAQDWTGLDIDPFPAMRHVTLCWEDGTATVRRVVEEELARALARIWTHDNPVGGWFMSIALGLFGATFFALLGIAVLQILRILHR